MIDQEAFYERRINARRLNRFALDPETEVGETAQIDADGAIGVALIAQRFDVRQHDALERAISQPVAASKVRKDSIGRHGVLLWCGVGDRKSTRLNSSHG